MAAPKRPTHVVIHPKLCLRVDGKMKRVPKGAQLTIDKDNLHMYERLIASGKIADLSDVETIDLSKEPEPDKG